MMKEVKQLFNEPRGRKVNVLKFADKETAYGWIGIAFTAAQEINIPIRADLIKNRTGNHDGHQLVLLMTKNEEDYSTLLHHMKPEWLEHTGQKPNETFRFTPFCEISKA